MIGNLLYSLIIGILFFDFLERRFPNYFKDYSLLASYSCIYYYSKLQILFVKITKQFNSLIDSNKILLNLKNSISKINFHEQELVENNIDYCEEYKFNIYNYPDNNFVNRAIFFNDSLIPKNEVTELKFILVEFKIGNCSYKIDLKTDTFNYYLIGNKFTREFFIYYIKKHNNITEVINDHKCSVKIIDQNVDLVIIDFTEKNESILLEKNGYKIL
jgi:hypothetical protein